MCRKASDQRWCRSPVAAIAHFFWKNPGNAHCLDRTELNEAFDECELDVKFGGQE